MTILGRTRSKEKEEDMHVPLSETASLGSECYPAHFWLSSAYSAGLL